VKATYLYDGTLAANFEDLTLSELAVSKAHIHDLSVSLQIKVRKGP
jgi:hypothetical protein